MISGISKGGTGFGNLQQLTTGDQAVTKVNGPDGQHFFYQQANEVVWVTIESTDAMSILKLVINGFKNH